MLSPPLIEIFPPAEPDPAETLTDAPYVPCLSSPDPPTIATSPAELLFPVAILIEPLPELSVDPVRRKIEPLAVVGSEDMTGDDATDTEPVPPRALPPLLISTEPLRPDIEFPPTTETLPPPDPEELSPPLISAAPVPPISEPPAFTTTDPPAKPAEAFPALILISPPLFCNPSPAKIAMKPPTGPEPDCRVKAPATLSLEPVATFPEDIMMDPPAVCPEPVDTTTVPEAPRVLDPLPIVTDPESDVAEEPLITETTP